MRTETEMEGCGHKPKDACRHQELEEAGKFIPWRFHGPAGILACERTNSCGVKSLVCGHLARGPGMLAPAAAWLGGREDTMRLRS